MPSKPAVIELIEHQKAALLAGEQTHMQELARRWLVVEHELETSIELLARDVADLKANGQTVGISKLIQLDRYQSLLRQTRNKFAKYASSIEPLIAGRQRSLAMQAIGDCDAALRTIGVKAGFNVLVPGAVESLLGFAGDGSPLSTLLEATWPDGVAGMTNALLKGAALGWHPQRTAKAMSQGAGASLNSMLRIARTEELRLYRETTRQQYIASNAVQGFRRLAAKNARTCAGCLMADGEEYELGETLREHVQGRCTTVPIIIGMKPTQWQRGPDWFRKQPDDVQRQVLGKGRYESYKAGKFDLDQLVQIQRNDTWGASVMPAPLKSLT